MSQASWQIVREWGVQPLSPRVDEQQVQGHPQSPPPDPGLLTCRPGLFPPQSAASQMGPQHGTRNQRMVLSHVPQHHRFPAGARPLGALSPPSWQEQRCAQNAAVPCSRQRGKSKEAKDEERPTTPSLCNLSHCHLPLLESLGPVFTPITVTEGPGTSYGLNCGPTKIDVFVLTTPHPGSVPCEYIWREGL